MDTQTIVILAVLVALVFIYGLQRSVGVGTVIEWGKAKFTLKTDPAKGERQESDSGNERYFENSTVRDSDIQIHRGDRVTHNTHYGRSGVGDGPDPDDAERSE